MLEIDTVCKAIENFSYSGEALSDAYYQAIDFATDPQLGRERWARAIRRLERLAKPDNDSYIRRQLQDFEFPPHITGLEEAYDSTITQVYDILTDYARQQG